MSGANIRLCIVTVYNCIMLVQCINFLLFSGGNWHYVQYLVCSNKFPVSSRFRSLNLDHHEFI